METNAIARIISIHHGHADSYPSTESAADADYTLGMCHGLQVALSKLGLYDESAICREYLSSKLRSR